MSSDWLTTDDPNVMKCNQREEFFVCRLLVETLQSGLSLVFLVLPPLVPPVEEILELDFPMH